MVDAVSVERRRQFPVPRLFRENAEYLGAQILAYDYGLSFLDILHPNARLAGDILKDYDSLRRPATSRKERSNFSGTGTHGSCSKMTETNGS